MTKIYTYFGFKGGKLVTVMQSTCADYESAVDADYVVSEPQEAQKQVAKWKEEVEKK